MCHPTPPTPSRRARDRACASVHNPWMAPCRISRLGAVLLCALAVGLAPAPGARADGDPASDYLIANQVFLGAQSSPLSAAQRQLLAAVRSANRAGFAIRVAVIPTEYDLGSITALWSRPGLYARFLGLELASAYRQRLLVVMPDGFGFSWPGHPVVDVDRLLAGAPTHGGAPGRLYEAAQLAIRRLAAAGHVRLGPAPAPAAGSGRSEGTGAAVIVAAVLGGLALFAAFAMVIFRRPRGSRPTSGTGHFPGSKESPVRLRWAIPAVAGLLTAVVVLSILALRRTTPQPPGASLVTPPPYTWPAGRRPAPAFTLRDQAGRAVSVRAFRGREVIVTFADPLCRNLCPVEAHLLNQVVAGMPLSRRPVILAVSVDVYSDARRNLIQDESRWGLVPQWHWAVGRPAELAAVWKRYQVGVSVITKRIAGTTIHYITHSELSYIVDASGHERALFVWPFYPQDLEQELRRLA